MKSLKWIVPAIAAIIFVMPALSFAQELRVGGEIWNRWTYESVKPEGSDATTLKNYFALERGYFDLRPKFSENTSGRFTVDMFSTDSQKDGAGLKLKYGFIDFNNLIPVPDMTLTAGLQKVYFGTIYDWDYSLITKAPTDEYKVANSADYGITLNGQLPSGFGEYAVGVYNGEGYKAFGKTLNISPEFLANIRLVPIAGVTLGGSFMTNSVDQDTCVVDASKYQKQMLMDGMARLAYGPVDVWMEYIYKDVEYPNIADGSRDYTANGIMVMPILSLRSLIGSDIQLIGRYDRWDHTDNPKDKYLLNTITGGVNYNFMHDEKESPKMQLQLNLVQKAYDEDESSSSYAGKKKDTTTVMMQLKYKFSSTIK
ncbi:MAG TPA: hypothetical protein PL126_06355 [Candidatus Cloacimonadota bacterium]|nr:hypothetical protein [Candidatus Cloacimonadota bacterium]